VGASERFGAFDVGGDAFLPQFEPGCIHEAYRDLEPFTVQRRFVGSPAEHLHVSSPGSIAPTSESTLLNMKSSVVRSLGPPRYLIVTEASVAVVIIHDKVSASSR
jgi:hypothetical protein